MTSISAELHVPYLDTIAILQAQNTHAILLLCRLSCAEAVGSMVSTYILHE